MKHIETLSNIFNFSKLLITRKREKDSSKVQKVHFISYRGFFPNGGVGGGSAVQSANKVLFGDELYGVPLKFTFPDDVEFQQGRENQLWDFFEAVKFTKKIVDSEKNTAYITHDYATAFALFLLGKKYVLVFHLQGSRVEEIINYSLPVTKTNQKIIKLAEKYAFQNAFKVCFPSKGAYEMCCNSPYNYIKRDDFVLGSILYNTLYTMPEPQLIENLDNNESLTFLSIGQLTYLKGIDQCCFFFEELLKIYPEKNKIRWIVVGSGGALYDQINEDMIKLQAKYSNFNFIYFSQLNYNQITYIQNICNVYIMLHRVSVFDLATLELMNKGKVIILSNVGGNQEFNKEDNILLYKSPEETAKLLLESDLGKLSELNKKTFQNYFSQENFKQYYFSVIKELMQ